MNPVDHPHGGGEGKKSGKNKTPWGKPKRVVKFCFFIFYHYNKIITVIKRNHKTLLFQRNQKEFLKKM